MCAIVCVTGFLCEFSNSCAEFMAIWVCSTCALLLLPLLLRVRFAFAMIILSELERGL